MTTDALSNMLGKISNILLIESQNKLNSLVVLTAMKSVKGEQLSARILQELSVSIVKCEV